jgi:hypothetical protein
MDTKQIMYAIFEQFPVDSILDVKIMGMLPKDATPYSREINTPMGKYVSKKTFYGLNEDIAVFEIIKGGTVTVEYEDQSSRTKGNEVNLEDYKDRYKIYLVIEHEYSDVGNFPEEKIEYQLWKAYPYNKEGVYNDWMNVEEIL